jgi:hypothetical protein
MNRTTVKSSFIQSIGYNAETRILEVEFKQGRVYQYFDVPKETYDNVMSAHERGESIGKMFPTISGCYAHARVDEKEEATADGVL